MRRHVLKRSFRPVLTGILTVGLAGGLWAEELDIGIRLDRENEEVVVSIPQRPGLYFTLEGTEAFAGFDPLAMNLGWQPVDWGIPMNLLGPVMTFRFTGHSVYGPLDTDGDGMDDVWELENGLNPLDPSDAFVDPDGTGLTNWQRYQLTGRGVPIKDVIGRELSLFNFGEPTAPLEALSREVSVFNGEELPRSTIQDVVGREVSLFNFGEVPGGSVAAESREVSIFNFGEPPAPVEAISREVSVFNGEEPPRTLIAEAYSREVSVFNFGQASAPLEAVSREISAFNDIDP